MKKIFIASLLAAFGLNAHASHITSLNDGVDLVMPAINYFGGDPQALGSNAMWSSDSAFSVFGYVGGYGFAGNGSWSDLPMVGSNSSDGTMTFTFNNAVSAFGGFMNFAPGHGIAQIAAYDANNHLLESVTLDFATNGGSNQGQFHGFRQQQAVIKSFTMSGAFIGGADFRVVETAPVPEPETWGMMLAGLAGLGLMARRRQAKQA